MHSRPAMDLSRKARRVTVDRAAQTLSISWADGHYTEYPLDGLRRACPCATCQGHGNMNALPDPEIFLVPSLMQWTDIRLDPVGDYALRIRWDDGHDTGIYTWDRLRRMCPCADCLDRP
ncbi:MAG: gamma-butyrobetaine hydroxylase-like domain-containing protein [Bacteroidota bacterium]